MTIKKAAEHCDANHEGGETELADPRSVLVQRIKESRPLRISTDGKSERWQFA